MVAASEYEDLRNEFGRLLARFTRSCNSSARVASTVDAVEGALELSEGRGREKVGDIFRGGGWWKAGGGRVLSEGLG